MASSYGSVHVPAGCTVKIGDTIGDLATVGVLKGDASIQISYDMVEVRGSKAEALLTYAKNMSAEATFELYQLYLTNIVKFLDGAAEVTNQTATELEDQAEAIASGAWAYDRFYPLENQQGAGTVPTISLVTAANDTDITVAMASVAADTTVTINGLTFTAHADTTTVANREFAIDGGTDTLDADELETCINDATYGVPGVTAANVTGTITLTVAAPTTTGIYAFASAGTFTIAAGLAEDTDYFVFKDPAGKWGIHIIDSATLTTESQIVTVLSTYTPAASKTLKMGAASAELTPKIVEFSMTNDSKEFRVRLWSVTNEAGLTLGFPDSDTDDLATIPITLKGGLDTSKTSGEQLVEVLDEIGTTV